MPVNIVTVSYTEADAIVRAVVEQASRDGGAPVAVAVVDAAARLICFAAMDGVMPASIRLSQAKAYSAVIGQQDTKNWAVKPKHPTLVDFDMRNWTDPGFTGFTGGLVILHSGSIIGGIGVSGRKGLRSETDTLMQDSELAAHGSAALAQLLSKG